MSLCAVVAIRHLGSFSLCVWALSWAVGCQASVNAEVKTASDEDNAFAELDEPEPTPLQTTRAETAALAQPKGDREIETPALLGARHDLYLKAGQPAVCTCLAAAAGNASDRRFVWESQIPQTDNESQIVVAFSSVDQGCAQQVHAAYRGYTQSGNDVIIAIEEAKEGRPALTGAIVPRPLPGGKLLIQPADTRLPFGKALSGGASCELTDLPQVIALGAAAPTEAALAKPAQAEQEPEPDLEPNFTGDVAEDAESEEDPSPEDLDDYGPAPHSARDSFYFGLLAGAGYALLDFKVASALPEGTLTGIPVLVDVMIGGSPIPNLAVGGVLGGGASSDPKLTIQAPPGTTLEQELGATGFQIDGDTVTLTGVNLNLLRVGAFADYYFGAESNLHGLLEVGYTSVSFSGGNSSSDDLTGLSLGAGLGYDAWLSEHWSLGLLARFSFASLNAQQSDLKSKLLLPSLLLSLTFH